MLIVINYLDEMPRDGSKNLKIEANFLCFLIRLAVTGCNELMNENSSVYNCVILELMERVLSKCRARKRELTKFARKLVGRLIETVQFVCSDLTV